MVESNAAAAAEVAGSSEPVSNGKIDTKGTPGEEVKEETPAIQEAVTGVTPLQKQEIGAMPQN